MLLLVLLQILRRFKSKGFEFNLNKIVKHLLFKIKYVFPFLLLSMSYSGNDTIKEERIAFEIINKDKPVGYIIVEKQTNSGMISYKVNSEVETRLVFSFKAIGKEHSIYRNDTLIFSSVYRKLNNKVKINQTLKLSKGIYAATNGKHKSNLDVGVITCNLVMLFFEEPTNRDKVYCDKLKTNLNIIKVNTGVYKVLFPNGSYTVYHYKKGLISHMDAVGSFYKVRLIKQQQKDYKNELTSI